MRDISIYFDSVFVVDKINVLQGHFGNLIDLHLLEEDLSIMFGPL